MNTNTSLCGFNVTPVANGVLIQFPEPYAGEPDTLITPELIEYVAEADHENVYLDFSTVESVGSVQIAKMVRLYKSMQKKKGLLFLLHVHPAVYDVLEVTRLNTLFGVSRAG